MTTNIDASSNFAGGNKYAETLAMYHTHQDDNEALLAAKTIIEQNKSADHTPSVLAYLLGTVEMTTLTVTDSDESVLQLVEKTNQFFDAHPELPPFASICVYPNFAKIVSESLEVEGIAVACVSGGFPASQTFIEIKTAETSLAVLDGATEIDMVLSVGKFLSGDYETVCDEIAEIKDACGDKPLKVILETGALKTTENIKKASLLAMYAGADFIKTSTGKIDIAATPLAVWAMCEAVKEYFEKTGNIVGIKVAGGVKTVEDAVGYYSIIRTVLGEKWLEEKRFRIGTSSLANLLISDILNEKVAIF